MLKHLPGMQMLNPVSYIADRASASAEFEISQTSVCCNEFYSTLASFIYSVSVFIGALYSHYIHWHFYSSILTSKPSPDQYSPIKKSFLSHICIRECEP